METDGSIVVAGFVDWTPPVPAWAWSGSGLGPGFGRPACAAGAWARRSAATCARRSAGTCARAIAATCARRSAGCTSGERRPGTIRRMHVRGSTKRVGAAACSPVEQAARYRRQTHIRGTRGRSAPPGVHYMRRWRLQRVSAADPRPSSCSRGGTATGGTSNSARVALHRRTNGGCAVPLRTRVSTRATRRAACAGGSTRTRPVRPRPPAATPATPRSGACRPEGDRLVAPPG